MDLIEEKKGEERDIEIELGVKKMMIGIKGENKYENYEEEKSDL